MERVLRVVDWLALTRRGQVTAGVAEAVLLVLTVKLYRLGHRLSLSPSQR